MYNPELYTRILSCEGKQQKALNYENISVTVCFAFLQLWNILLLKGKDKVEDEKACQILMEKMEMNHLKNQEKMLLN